MGGLVSAIILAKEGLKVCVLEKNNQFGGNLQTFSRNKMIFDTGVHYIGGLDKGQNLYKFFKYIGIMDDLKLKKMNEDAYDYITFDNDQNVYPHAQGYDNFISQLSKYFPNEKKTIEKYCNDIKSLCNSFPLYNLELGSGYDEKVLSIKSKEYFDKLTDNEDLKAVLSGSGSLYGGNGNTTPLYVHALSVNSYMQSAWKCIRGGSQITKLLIRQLKKHGGDAFKRQKVTNFEFDDENRLVSVKTSSGHHYFADKFISNIDLNATINLADKNRFRKSFYKRIERLEVTPAPFTVYIAFKPNSFPYLNSNIYHFKDKKHVWDGANYNIEEWPTNYMASFGVSREGQKYADSLSIMTYMRFEEMEPWVNTHNTYVDKNERGQDYEAFKEEKIELILRELEKKFPKIRESISSVHTSTPLTYRDYIGGKKGNMYGFEKDADSPMKTFISPRTKISNLFLTGQSVNMHGILGVTIGAFVTCSEIVGKEYLINKMNEELMHAEQV